MVTAARIAVGVLSTVTIVFVPSSAIRTIVLPRGVPSRLSRVIFLLAYGIHRLRTGRNADYDRRDRVLASLGPYYLLNLVVAWLALLWLAFAGLFWALEHRPFPSELVVSASSLTTLGIAVPAGTGYALAAAAEALLALGLLAMLISYLPSLYSAFSRREAAVNKLAVRAGTPPVGVELLAWSWRFDRFDALHRQWADWEDWFAELGETHTSTPALVWFRSPRPHQSWITASGAVLDAASLHCAAVDRPRDVDAELCIRAGYLALREVADFLGIAYDPDPRPDSPISVARTEFDVALAALVAAGVPVRADRDAAWRDFAGWRVTYDRVLVPLATSLEAPWAPWSSDRSITSYRRPPLLLFSLKPRAARAGLGR